MKTISSKLLRQADGQSAEEQQLAACWPAFLICLRAATNSPRLINLQEMTEFLLNLLPRIDLTVRSDLTQAVNLLLQLTIQQRSDGMAANRELVARLLEAGCEPNLLRTVLELLDRDVQWLDTGEELVSLSRLLRDQGEQCEESITVQENLEIGFKVAAKVFFNGKNEEMIAAYKFFFAHLSNQEGGSKFIPAKCGPAAILVDFLERGGDMSLVLMAARDQPAWLRCKLFGLALHLQGLHQHTTAIIHPKSVLASKLTVAVGRPPSPAGLAGNLGRLYRYSLPLDLCCELSDDGTTAGRLLQAATKMALEQCRLEDLSSLLASLHRHHPHTLEPLVSLVLARLVTVLIVL